MSAPVPVVVAIHVAPASRLPMREVETVEAVAGEGLVGDRYHGTRHRHVTLQSRTDLDESAGVLGRPIDPAGTRRNITISHGTVPSRPGSRVTIGGVEMEVLRAAAPCRLLDDALGPGAQTALRSRAGSVCRLLTSGTIAVGAPVVFPDETG